MLGLYTTLTYNLKTFDFKKNSLTFRISKYSPYKNNNTRPIYLVRSKRGCPHRLHTSREDNVSDVKIFSQTYRKHFRLSTWM